MEDALHKVGRVLDLQSFRSELENAQKSELNSWAATCNCIKKQKVRLKVTLPPPDSEVESVVSLVMITYGISCKYGYDNLWNQLMWVRKTIFMGLL